MRRPTYRLALAVLFAVSSLAHVASAATFVVDTTADSGAGSLRQAITDANAAADVDTISFAIPDAGIPQIAPASDLPAITNPVTVDGTTQSPAGRVELSGTTTQGFQIGGTGITIRGFVVNGFTTSAITITGAGPNVVEGNYLGTDTAGAASASPSSATGIIISWSGDNLIGGWDAAARNVISGNGTGILFTGAYAVPNVVVGNFIGTDATGLVALPNVGHGITSVQGSANIIGGTAAGAGNVISGNSTDGIAISGSGYDIQGNLIGVGVDGTTAVPNARHGVRLFNTAADTHVGDDAGNTIAYNKSAGVLVAVNAGAGNVIRGNSIHDNTALGIDISGTGVNANDALDADGGSNLTQNFPVLDSGFTGGASIAGTLDSAVSTTFTVDLYASPSCDSSGYGEGSEWVGTLSVATDVSGHAAFTAPVSRTIGAGEFMTATATDPAGNTSEFSYCAPVPPPPTTSTSTTTSSSTTTATTSSTTTSTATPTTSSTSTSDVTTSSTSTTAVPTTSTSSTTTDPGDTTTSTTTLAPPTTTSTTLAPAPTTTSTTPDTTTSTTSTSAPDTTTTSFTEPPATTTSTSTVPDTTTTSTTDPSATTTSTTTLDPTTTSTSSTTSTSAPDTTTTTTSSTDSTSTSSTTAVPSTTSTTSAPLGTTSTSTTAPPTTTTTPSCVGSDCSDPGCGPQVAFAPLRCRLNGLATEVDDTPALAPMRDHMERHLAKAMALFDKAQSRCQLAKRRPAKRSLRLVRQRLVKVGKALRSKLARKTLPPTVTDPIGREASALGLDVRALATTISCR